VIDTLQRYLSELPSHLSALDRWIIYVSPIGTLLALVMSYRALRYTRATYRRSAPRVKVSFFHQYRDREHVYVMISLSNSGLAPVGIESFRLYPGLRAHVASPRLGWGDEDDWECVEGETLPTTLSQSSSLRWRFEVKRVRVDRHWTLSSDPDTMFEYLQFTTLKVRLGNGHVVKHTNLLLPIADRVGQWFERVDRWIERWEPPRR
jgi:hypothetical protein